MSKLSNSIAVMKKYQNRKSYDDFTTMEKLIVILHAQAKSTDSFVSAMSFFIKSCKTNSNNSPINKVGGGV